MRRLVLVRHGESEWNVERRIQGQSGTGLSPRGRAQAEVTAAFLADQYPRATVHVSDLQRCAETAAPLEVALGVSAVVDEGLRERHFGDWTGLLTTEVEREHRGLWDRWRTGEDVVAEVGGEGTEAFTERIVGCLERIVASSPTDDVVCITHGGPVWHGTKGLLALPDHVLGGVGNASVTEVLTDPAWGRRLGAFNQTSHLPQELRGWPRVADRPESGDRDAPPVGT